LGIEQFIKWASTILQPHQRAWFCTLLNLGKEKIFASAASGLKSFGTELHILTNTKTEFPTPYFKDEDTTFILQLPQSHYY
jgi:hypothetical protein